MKGVIFDINEASIHDGDGLRVAVFLKGCPLHCRWCHSPEGQGTEVEYLTLPDGTKRVSGEFFEAENLALYLKNTVDLLENGGITFSGGEPMLQSDFLLEVLEKLQGVHTIIETSGFAEQNKFLQVAEKVSLIHYGLKIINRDKSKFWTSCDSKIVVDNLLALDKNCKTPYIIRMPLLAGIIDTDENMRDLMNLVNSLERLTKIE